MRKKYRRLQGTGCEVTVKGQVKVPVFCLFVYLFVCLFVLNSLGGWQRLDVEEDDRVEERVGLLCVTGFIGYFYSSILMWE